MDISKFSEQFSEKMREVQAYIDGDEVRELMAGIAIEHFRESFRNEGFADEQLNPWAEVERRKPESSWYGHSGQTGRFSLARTTAKILSGETGHLSNAFSYARTKEGIVVRNTAPYARVHQYGLKAKVYGKKEFAMPKRPFMGASKRMAQEIRQEVINDIKELLK
ncbi:phage virion morphogenesis protein [Porphyromonas levii]|uniref:phage virion morphogenesis protein n=1 Tax=Porphyromonas levii TaxID=28114 RepID=UPI001B8D40D4|nr:phage virion morphogenesis protein [Porphyromonas levii]MBR8713030.1 hypothetical protein [Porphyromonas levii]MBR8715077.1 hypothetical protein [Porphyromonas levii]MBR8727559.1 hypothetical protein [Porphyromonas levii]MBR8735938.1 hypothetical protein [Porphyromonas levii]MBR8765267.1 hypothetical protein [Porphyromonas levii]